MMKAVASHGVSAQLHHAYCDSVGDDAVLTALVLAAPRVSASVRGALEGSVGFSAARAPGEERVAKFEPDGCWLTLLLAVAEVPGAQSRLARSRRDQ